MKATVKKRWLKALRSGEYQQTTQQLRDDAMPVGDSVVAGYCCLGVLCEVMGAKYEPDAGLPRDMVLDAAGLPDAKARRLAVHNDDGHSFKWIAAYIERYL